MIEMEILEALPVSNDQTIAKGKRTKRPRLSSSSSSSGSGAAATGQYKNSSVYSSPTTSTVIPTRTEEDEDMAKCLILLARGKLPPQAAAAENKFSSQNFTEMATTTTGKDDIYVYECKTCNRTFPSFQALGGHKASHKKPKPAVDFNQKKSPQADDHEKQFSKLISITPPDSSLLSNKICHIKDQIKPKIHKCSICESEFASGQALGGHMRRHRAAAPTADTRIGASIDNDISSDDIGKKPKNMLAPEFDLNLPAPPEDDKFNQFSPKQQPRIVFYAAALVACHY